MAAQDAEIAARTAGEETPLLGSTRRGSEDDGSEGTLTDLNGGEREVEEDSNKANQQVGRLRGLFIILGVWGLIFLQGESHVFLDERR
jgi:hypothetical protein